MFVVPFVQKDLGVFFVFLEVVLVSSVDFEDVFSKQ